MSAQVPLSAPDITDAEIAAVTAVLRTPRLCMGPELAAFEEELAGYHAVGHAVAVSSGTAGLHLALLALGIEKGDEIILPSFTFAGVLNAVVQVNAVPILVEIDPLTLDLDPEAVERAITPRTRAILVVHTFGIPAEMDALGSIARRPRVLPQQANDHGRGRGGAGPRPSARGAPAKTPESRAGCERRMARPDRAGI
jgi:dTDP-4-amino-4,6-dideoxygalactose transaminase